VAVRYKKDIPCEYSGKRALNRIIPAGSVYPAGIGFKRTPPGIAA